LEQPDDLTYQARQDGNPSGRRRESTLAAYPTSAAWSAPSRDA